MSKFSFKMLNNIGVDAPKSVEKRKHPCSKTGDGMQQYTNTQHNTIHHQVTTFFLLFRSMYSSNQTCNTAQLSHNSPTI